MRNGAVGFGERFLQSDRVGCQEGFLGRGAAGFSRFGKEHGWADGGGGGGSEVKVPALRFAIGRDTRQFV